MFMRLSPGGAQFSKHVMCRKKMQKVSVEISANGWKNVEIALQDGILSMGKVPRRIP
ncbi:MAG: hypothetical protein KKD12_08095 [Proteobacteria bacterium]|nr:hypothetical protein [Pseudomonadota bacterium]